MTPLKEEDIRSTPPVWVVMPILANPDLTRTAIASVLAQSVPIRLLLINQGVEDAFRDELEAIAEEYPDRVLLWSHQPPLPSLAATWNRALDFVWEVGGQEALVVNNDLRLDPWTVETLQARLAVEQALFVSCVGWDERHWMDTMFKDREASAQAANYSDHGGPDFSCFLIARACHDRFRFDEAFTPAFCEDLDYHRRLLLAGEGARIFSVNLPYLHHASQTLKSVDPQARMKIEKAIAEGSRTYYRKKWGGDVNQETYLQEFGGGWHEPSKVTDGTATTPYLQAHLPPDALSRADTYRQDLDE